MVRAKWRETLSLAVGRRFNRTRRVLFSPPISILLFGGVGPPVLLKAGLGFFLCGWTQSRDFSPFGGYVISGADNLPQACPYVGKHTTKSGLSFFGISRSITKKPNFHGFFGEKVVSSLLSCSPKKGSLVANLYIKMMITFWPFDIRDFCPFIVFGLAAREFPHFCSLQPI